MALTGRLGLLALLGALVPLFAPSWWGLFAVWGVLLLGVVADLVLAGNVRKLRFHRAGDTSVRLGETAQVALIVENLGGGASRPGCGTCGRPARAPRPARSRWTFRPVSGAASR